MTYPIVPNMYRFRGGWTDTPRQLQDLVVGHPYTITPSGDNDYMIRGARNLILIDQETFDKYFEPYVDYFAEPEEEEPIDLTTKDSAVAPDEPFSIITREEASNCVRIDHSNTEFEQMELFSL